jgi:hypothetical protein
VLLIKHRATMSRLCLGSSRWWPLLLLLGVLLLGPAAAQRPGWSPPANKSDWRSRTIYQVLIDRFDRGDGRDSVRQLICKWPAAAWLAAGLRGSKTACPHVPLLAT